MQLCYKTYFLFYFILPLIQAIAIKFTAVLFQSVSFMPTLITKHIPNTKLSAACQKFNMC